MNEAFTVYNAFICTTTVHPNHFTIMLIDYNYKYLLSSKAEY